MANEVNMSLMENFKFFVSQKDMKQVVDSYLKISEEFKVNYSPLNHILSLLQVSKNPAYAEMIESLLAADSNLESVLIDKVNEDLYYLLEPVYRSIGVNRIGWNGNNYIHTLMSNGCFDLVITLFKEMPDKEVYQVCSEVNNLGLTPLMIVFQSSDELTMTSEQFQFFDHINKYLFDNKMVRSSVLNELKSYVLNILAMDKILEEVTNDNFKLRYFCSISRNENIFSIKGLIK